MIITVIGWYGTETIGDRAILAGLISLFNKSYSHFEIKIGSLYPFFTERTVVEDVGFYTDITNKNIKVDIFNSTSTSELVAAIKCSDLVVMGGGPLMDLHELFMIEYAFKKAKKLGVQTALCGCGVGPLFHKKFRKSVLNIVANSDIVILRDELSKNKLREIYHEFSKEFDSESILTSYDPAVECALEYKKLPESFIKPSNIIVADSSPRSKDYVAVNLRSFPSEYSKDNILSDINKQLGLFVKDIASRYLHLEIKLIPMHYFHIGGDDRVFLNQIALESDMKNISVQNVPLTLKETMSVFKNSDFGIGMRFHSVILQTMVAGNNFVLDYTEPRTGKISGFLRDIDHSKFFDERYIALQSDCIDGKIIKDTEARFAFDSRVTERLGVYVDKLKYLQR